MNSFKRNFISHKVENRKCFQSLDWYIFCLFSDKRMNLDPVTTLQPKAELRLFFILNHNTHSCQSLQVLSRKKWNACIFSCVETPNNNPGAHLIEWFLKSCLFYSISNILLSEQILNIQESRWCCVILWYLNFWVLFSWNLIPDFFL